MKSINDLAKKLENIADKYIEKNMIKAQEKTAKSVYNDIVALAPKGTTNNYVNSIKIDKTEVKDGKITTFIGSDLTVGPTIHGSVQGSKNAPAGTKYNLGYLLENGTFEHAIPNAFGYGFYYSYTDEKGFHKGTLDDNWHPGTIAQPHYSIAIEKNKKLYKDNIRMTWREL